VYTTKYMIKRCNQVLIIIGRVLLILYIGNQIPVNITLLTKNF